MFDKEAYMEGVGSQTSRPQSQAEKEFTRIDTAINVLEKEVSAMEMQLSLVMIPSSPEAELRKDEGAGNREMLSPLSESLSNSASRISRAVSRLQGMRNRLRI